MRAAIGTSVPRKEALAKVTGQARYVDDLHLPGMIHGITVRAQVPHGRLKGIRFGEGVPWSEIVVVTAKDIPARNVVHLIVDDQPALVSEVIQHREEPVVLLAHADRALLERARALVELDVEPWPALLDLDQAMAGGGRVIKEYRVDKGDLAAAFAAADVVVEGTYTTGAQEHAYIEPNGVVAYATAEGGVTVWGSLQCPYYVQKALMGIFGVPPDKARVVQLETGGGFGGKEEYPSLLASHAALLSLKAGRPVKIIYDRDEDMAATTKRHPSRTTHRTALGKDGTILGMDIDFTLDGGAYATLSQVVLSRGTIHAAGPYACPNVRIRSRALYTNTPPHGAFRGFGAPQSFFALERHLDECAARLGLPPEELRRRNFVAPGGTLATGQVVRDRIDMAKLLGDVLAESGWADKKRRFAAENAGPAPKTRRGLGLACFMHGTGFTGSGEKYLASVVAVEATPEGRLRVLASSTEIGQGTNTVFAQIVGDALGVPPDLVDVARPDTRDVPNSGPTVASRTVTIVGKLAETAALGLRQTLLDVGFLRAPYTADELQAACAAYLATLGPLRATAEYRQPPHISWDDATYRGDAYGAFSWAVYVAEVSVDLTTYQAKVDGFWATQEVGKVMNPVLAGGQIEGGVAQGIGWALYEDVAWQGGRMANNTLTNYVIPTSADLPPIHVTFAEADYPYGPHGAKGIGELPMDGPAPAILNAIRDALGVAINRVPATPEAILEALAP